MWLQQYKFNNSRRWDDQRGGDERRIRYAIDDREEDHHPQQRSRNWSYENNVGVSQSEIIAISTLSSSSPLNL